MEPEHEENQVENETEEVVSVDSPLTLTGNEKEGASAGVAASDHHDKNSESMQPAEEAPGEEGATSEPEESSGDEPPGVDNLTSREDVDVKMDEVSESVVELSNHADDDDDDDDVDGGPPRLHLDTPDRESSGAGEDPGDTRYEESMRLLQELSDGREAASRHSSRLHARLAEHLLRKRAGEDGRLGAGAPASQQLQDYDKLMRVLSDLKQQAAADSEAAQQREEELSSESRERLDEVEREWRAFMALKQEAAVAALSRRLGKKVAQASVESALTAEQLRQDQLIELRLKHIKLKMGVHRLEAELRDGAGGHAKDPIQLQFEQLQAQRRERRKEIEKQNEESLKMQRKIRGCLEVLSNVKEKLHWSVMEVRAKREQLAEVEAAVAGKRDLLTRTKQARSRLQRDSARLKERRGLLGNRLLLRDFEDTVDASDQLEEHLENLKGRQAEIVFRCGRRTK